MNKKIVLTLPIIVATTGAFAFTRTKSATPSDFRDAMAEDFNTSIPSFDTNMGDFPIPKAVAANKKKSKTQSETEETFIFVHLHSKPFMRINPEKTKKNVEFFFKNLNMNMISYQDNNVSRAIEIKFREPKGAIDKIKAIFTRTGIIKQIKNFPEVKSMRNINKGAPLKHLIIFKQPIYPKRVNELFNQFGNEFQIVNRYQNTSMLNSIWVDISIKNMDNPDAVAKDLLNRFKDKIRYAWVSKRVQVFNATVQ